MDCRGHAGLLVLFWFCTVRRVCSHGGDGIAHVPQGDIAVQAAGLNIVGVENKGLLCRTCLGRLHLHFYFLAPVGVVGGTKTSESEDMLCPTSSISGMGDSTYRLILGPSCVVGLGPPCSTTPLVGDSK